MKKNLFQSGSRNALLTEITVVILFFALSSVVLLNLFSKVHATTQSAKTKTQAVIFVQNLSESLKAGENMENVLSENGFGEENGEWMLDTGEFTVRASLEEANGYAGKTMTCRITASYDETVLTSVPVSKYTPGEAAQ